MRTVLTISAVIAALCLPLAADTYTAVRPSGVEGRFTPLIPYEFAQLTGDRPEQSQAASAHTMIRLTWLQIAISILGTAGLVVTLGLNTRAIRQTDRSIRHAEFVARQQLRPYLDVEFAEARGADFGNKGADAGDVSREDVNVTISDEAYGLRIYFKMANRGQTPARDVRAFIGWQIIPGQQMEFEPPPLGECNVRIRDIAPNGSRNCFIGHRDPHRARLLKAFRSGRERVAVWIRVEFVDVFDQPQWVNYSAFIGGMPPVLEHHNPAFMGSS